MIDIDTIIPAMLIDAGGTSIHIGILTAIMLGGSSFAQLFFTPVLSNRPSKKGFLLLGINLRIIALIGLGLLLFWFTEKSESSLVIWTIFILITLFSISGAFASIGYSDILGRSIFYEKRKSFLSLRQAVSSIGILLSAYFAAKILVVFSYPLNYSWLFITAGLLLGIASLGFWNIKEIPGPVVAIGTLKRYLLIIANEIKENKRLANYLLVVNTLGISLALMPFLILYANEMFEIDNSVVGTFLVLKVIAGVISGTLLFYYAKRIKYTFLLYATSALALVIPISLFFFSSLALLGFYFFIGGVMYTFYKVAIEGVLLEISDHNNRTIYIGMVGAGNILPAIFPIVGGWLIPNFGFPSFFILFSVIIALSIYFIRSLKCMN
jgi:MFS family permease